MYSLDANYQVQRPGMATQRSIHSTPGHQGPAAKPEGGSKLSRAGSRRREWIILLLIQLQQPPQAPSGVKRATSLMAKRVTKPLAESKLGRSVSARISSSI